MSFCTLDTLKWTALYSVPFVGELIVLGESKHNELELGLFEQIFKTPDDREKIDLAKRQIKNHTIARILGNIIKLVGTIALAIFVHPLFVMLSLKFVWQAGYEIYRFCYLDSESEEAETFLGKFKDLDPLAKLNGIEEGKRAAKEAQVERNRNFVDANMTYMTPERRVALFLIFFNF